MRVTLELLYVVRTSNDNGEKRKAAITLHERVEDDPSAAADDHGNEERRPSLFQEMADVFISMCNIGPSNGSDSKDDNNDDGNRCAEHTEVRLGYDPKEGQSDEISETRCYWRSNVV